MAKNNMTAPNTGLTVEQTQRAKTPAEMQAEIDALKAQNNALRAQEGVLFKVSEKGAVSCYFPGARFPATLYPNQWIALIDKHQQLREFIEANRDKLSFERKKTEKNVDVK